MIRQLSPVADYFVVNISSPNTPGLRNLQQKKKLKEIISQVQKTMKDIHNDNSKHGSTITKRRREKIPLLVKIAPDLDGTVQYDIKLTLRVFSHK